MYQTPYFPEITSQANIGRISYFNVAPVYFGMENLSGFPEIKVQSRPPAVLNQMMKEGQLDISPVSATAYARNADQWMILPDLSISCIGRVMSVLLVSREPFERLDKKRVFLTSDSVAAADLLRLLFACSHIKPVFCTASIKHPDDLNGDADAGLVIGDAALAVSWRKYYCHVYDLGDMWYQLTGLPFVFAVWAVRRCFADEHPELVERVTNAFQLSKKSGLAHIVTIAGRAAQGLGMDFKTAMAYFLSLDYGLGDLEYKGLKTFFNMLCQYGRLDKPVTPRFFIKYSCPKIQAFKTE